MVEHIQQIGTKMISTTQQLFFVSYGINYRGAFYSQPDAEKWAKNMSPIKINGSTVRAEVVELEAEVYDGVAIATRYNAQAPIGRCIYFDEEICLESELEILGENHPLYDRWLRGYYAGLVDETSRKNPYADKKEKEAWELGYSWGGIQSMLDE